MEQGLGRNEVSRLIAINHFSLKAGLDGNLWPVVEAHLLTQHTGIAVGPFLLMSKTIRQLYGSSYKKKYFDVTSHTTANC